MKILAITIAAIGAAAVAYQATHVVVEDVVEPSGVSEFEAAMAITRPAGRRLKVRPVRFYAMGDAPYSHTEKENLPGQIDKLDPDVDFAIHLGDMQDRTPQCRPGPYNELAQVLKGSEVPMFIIPGDNCYYDCANWQAGWEYWKDAFLGFHENWDPKYNVRIQPVRKENFAVTWHRVLFIGIHTLWTRRIKNMFHWKDIENDNINWTVLQLRQFAHTGKVDAVVILSHSYTRSSLYKKYNKLLSQEASTLGLPFLFLQGDAHRFRQDTPFEAKNILRTVVDRGGLADPVHVTVDLSKDNPFIFEQRKLSGM